MKIFFKPFFINIFFIKSKYKRNNSVKNYKGITIKLFQSGLHMLIQIILLHGFDVCISIVRLNRYAINLIMSLKCST